MKTPLISPVPKVIVTTSRSPLSGTCGRQRCWWVIFGSPRYPYHPWDRYISLHDWLIFIIVNVGKYNHTWILWDLVRNKYQMIEAVTFLGWLSSRDIVNLTNPTIAYQLVGGRSHSFWKICASWNPKDRGEKKKHILIISIYHHPDEYFQNILDLEFLV